MTTWLVSVFKVINLKPFQNESEVFLHNYASSRDRDMQLVLEDRGFRCARGEMDISICDNDFLIILASDGAVGTCNECLILYAHLLLCENNYW